MASLLRCATIAAHSMTHNAWTGFLLAGRYHLTGPLGAGGMGALYRARDLTTGTDVAAKLLLDDVARDPVMRERFAREALALRHLRHPNIVEYRDHGEHEDVPWLVMELLTGESLIDRLRRGAMPVDEAVSVALAIARALDQAHGASMVHRDLKPANVFLCSDGVVKLIDFGVARIANEHTLTAANQMIGSLKYMSPEQGMGARVTPASDLYALGVTFFAMLTARLPFDGPDFARRRAVEEAPRVRSVAPAVTPELDQLVARLLQRDPQRRHASARAVADELSLLQTLMSATTVRAVPATPQATTFDDPRRYRALWELDQLHAQRAQIAATVATLEAQLGTARESLLTIDLQLAALEANVRAWRR
jgi:serine/threonine-protein kinase